MGDIVLFDPHRIYHSFNTILKAEVEDVFRMRIADGETKIRPIYQSIEDCSFIVIICCYVDKDIIAILTRSNNSQGIFYGQSCPSFVTYFLLHRNSIVYRAVNTGT